MSRTKKYYEKMCKEQLKEIYDETKQEIIRLQLDIEEKYSILDDKLTIYYDILDIMFKE